MDDLAPYNGGFAYQLFVTFVVFAVVVVAILLAGFIYENWLARRRLRERERRRKRRRPF